VVVIHAPLVQERIRQLIIRVPQIVRDRSSCWGANWTKCFP